MAINPKKISDTVKAIVEKYSWLLRYVVLGPKSITRAQLKLLVKSGMLQPHMVKFTLGDVYLQAHMDALKGLSRKSVREYSLRHLRTTAGELIDKWMNKQATDYSSIIQNNLLVHEQKKKEIVRDELAEGVLRNKSAKAIASAIRDKTKDFGKDWDRVVSTELARAQNLGSLDAIIENNAAKDQKEILVYKQGVKDERLCKYCGSFWFMPDGSPRVYKLSELVSNGSNYGKKAADWKPTIDITHPNCRCILLELPKGFGFRNGSLSFIGRDHDEYKAQHKKQ